MIRRYAPAVLLLAALAACGRKTEEAAKLDAFPVRTATASRQDVEDALSVVGSLKARDEATLYSRIAGKLLENLVREGDPVRKDQTVALNAYLKKKLGEMPVSSTLDSYQRGDGEGLVQNGIIFGTANLAWALDATTQPNGYYTLRLTTFATTAAPDQPQDARQYLQQTVTVDDPSLVWTPLMSDIKTLDWKFLDFNQTVWVELWSSSAKPNLVEFSMQPAGDLMPTTMDFWLPQIIGSSAVNRAGGAQ